METTQNPRQIYGSNFDRIMCQVVIFILFPQQVTCLNNFTLVQHSFGFDPASASRPCFWSLVSKNSKQNPGATNSLRAFQPLGEWIEKKTPWYSWWLVTGTVDGRSPAPVEVGSFSHYLWRVLVPSQVVGNGISEPSTVCDAKEAPISQNPMVVLGLRKLQEFWPLHPEI